ncbi:GNAT family N-acetyltransferase [Leucobacter chromiireducens]|uniref:GNAT family N-acetyltransferase n=1 Tax=Leucobacter chromiireducens TaxID=283877 RepID=UPI000F638CCA|nr:GNAT family N-acetyltransferase [Leucobacter chromiireducens]
MPETELTPEHHTNAAPAAPDFVIRGIAEGEYPAEAALVHAAYAESTYGAQLADDAEWLALERDTAGRDADGRILVAARGDELIGAVSVLRGGTRYAKLAAAGEVELRLVVVAPSARGAGVGEALVRAGIEEAMRWGAREVRLDTGVQNPAARLYARIGFARTPELDHQLDGANYGASLSFSYPLQERPDVRVREIRDAEIAAVSELVLAAYRDDYEGLPGEYLAEIADVAARAAEHRVWVAEDTATGTLLATITTPRPGEVLSDVARPGEMDLRLLGVSGAARGRGIGSLMMRHGLRLGRVRAVDQVVLNTSTEMVAAYEMYDRMGFARLLDREHEIVRADGTSFRLLAYGIDPALASLTRTPRAA